MADRGQAAAATAERKAVMATLGEASTAELAQGLARVSQAIDYVAMRPVETGLAMVRGRVGGDGAPFNLGEATVTRAAVRLASGEAGFSYVLGRDQEKARLCALCDALWQSGPHREAVERHVLAPVRARRQSERARQQAETAATKVDFFTLVRGED
jgi:alpha-D-ribose 1-methylphosphonate 5-triphosphate synthase subunit PhnG